MKTIIFFASQGANVGKTTTATKYKKHLSSTTNNVEIYSFATPIKKYCNILFELGLPQEPNSFSWYYNQREYKSEVLENIIPTPKEFKYKQLTFREFINSVSDDMIDLFGKNIWGDYALKYIEQSKNEVILIDDFRTPVEYNAIISKLDLEIYNIKTVFLKKENPELSCNSTWEGLLLDFPFDLEFTFNSDYSNIDELFNVLDI